MSTYAREYRVLQNGCCEQHSTYDSPLNFHLTSGAKRLAKSGFKVQLSRELNAVATTSLQNPVNKWRNLSFSVVHMCWFLFLSVYWVFVGIAHGLDNGAKNNNPPRMP